ncbi:hypothetical protein PF011_g32988 [Phytophthora fragariae]|uniref:Uncharacterized protein n=1 Tax=Phytophthora fragariae TaxID=53985 RepID=A0A6A3G3S9_9STRA|nr:hypothetical protein PF011_g32988 [Phytophthora fragariae]
MEAASVLWEAITKHFEAGDGINPDYLLRELMMRMLQPNEKVDAYAEDIELKVTKLRQAKGDFADWQQASLLLSNSVRVFPDLTRDACALRSISDSSWSRNPSQRVVPLPKSRM